MSEKSAARVKLERALLESVYQMASESLDPIYFEELEGIIRELCENRDLGDFDFFPRENEKL